MEGLIYLLVVAAVLWAVFFLARHFSRMLRGTARCDGDCSHCNHRQTCPDEPGSSRKGRKSLAFWRIGRYTNQK